MKKYKFTIFALIIFSFFAQAKHISKETAIKVAESFLKFNQKILIITFLIFIPKVLTISLLYMYFHFLQRALLLFRQMIKLNPFLVIQLQADLTRKIFHLR